MGKVDYKALLEEAMEMKVEAERVIAFAKRKLGQALDSGNARPTSGIMVDMIPSVVEDDTFHTLNILQAAEKYLRMVGRPARSTEEIAEMLTKGGLSTTQGSVATILGRSKDSQISRVKRGLWGLKEWYTDK
jgi:hypothetical protein